MTMITPSYLGETIEYSSLHACRSTLEDPTKRKPQPQRVAAYVGWFRLPGKRWQKVVDGETEWVCWSLLGEYRHRSGAVACERTVLRVGERPPKIGE